MIIVEILESCVRFIANAILPALCETFDLSVVSAFWPIGIAQLGYVVGAILSWVFNLTDRIQAQWLRTAGAAAAAVATFLLPLSV